MSELLSSDSHDHTVPIGLIGAGLMGKAIAVRLRQASRKVLVWDIDRDRCDELSTYGVQSAANAKEVADACPQIVLSLPDDQVVRRVIEEIEPSLRAQQTIIDTSTGRPEASRALADRLHALGLFYLEAPVSGSSEQLREGEAILFVGATELSFRAAEELLRSLSRSLHFIGLPGCASQMKLVHNLVLGLNRAALAEGLSLAIAWGLKPAETLRLLRQSMAYSKVMDSKGEKMIKRNFEPQATLAQHRKDVKLMLEDGGKVGMELPLTTTHLKMLDEAVELGWGAYDNSAIIETFRSVKPISEDS